MADFLEELENMAANASCTQTEPTDADIERWQLLFDFSHGEGEAKIIEWRSDINQSHVSDEHWDLVQTEQQARGFDREAYEYYLYAQQTMPRKTPMAMPLGTTQGMPLTNKEFIVKLEGPITSAEKVREVAQLTLVPAIARGTGETENAAFCKIDGLARQKIETWIKSKHPWFTPAFIPLSMSLKQLCSHSLAPMLGQDATLPQHRLDRDLVPRPTQDEYPVWYFFYGNLARSEELQQRLGLMRPPEYVPASIRGGKIRSWRGKYRALVDADSSSREEGAAYLVTNETEEDILRSYETEKYEVVRCVISLDGIGGEKRDVHGLAFRFAGLDEELE